VGTEIFLREKNPEASGRQRLGLSSVGSWEGMLSPSASCLSVTKIILGPCLAHPNFSDCILGSLLSLNLSALRGAEPQVGSGC
ncbi:mCG145675, partial [Mus musculus]